MAEQTDLRAGEDGRSGAAASARAHWRSRSLLGPRSGFRARQGRAAARAEPRRSTQVRRLLGASSGAPRHALQRPDVREPEPDSAGIHRVSPEEVRPTEAAQAAAAGVNERDEMKPFV